MDKVKIRDKYTDENLPSQQQHKESHRRLELFIEKMGTNTVVDLTLENSRRWPLLYIRRDRDVEDELIDYIVNTISDSRSDNTVDIDYSERYVYVQILLEHESTNRIILSLLEKFSPMTKEEILLYIKVQ